MVPIQEDTRAGYVSYHTIVPSKTKVHFMERQQRPATIGQLCQLPLSPEGLE
jgi:hypothetical protein